MTRGLLNRIAKIKGINPKDFMKVDAFINDTYTKIFVIFYDVQGVSLQRIRCNEKVVTLSIFAIQKRAEELPEDYECSGVWISDLKN